MHSVPITTNLVSSNPFPGEVYSIQLNVISLSVICEICGFPRGFIASSSNKTDHHDISEILLKVVLNILTLTPNNCSFDINCKFSANDEK